MGVAAGQGVMSMGAESGLLRGEVVGVSLMVTAADVSSTRAEPELLSTGVAVSVSSTGAGPVLMLLFAFQSMFISVWVSRLEIVEFPDDVCRSVP